VPSAQTIILGIWSMMPSPLYQPRRWLKTCLTPGAPITLVPMTSGLNGVRITSVPSRATTPIVSSGSSRSRLNTCLK